MDLGLDDIKFDISCQLTMQLRPAAEFHLTPRGVFKLPPFNRFPPTIRLVEGKALAVLAGAVCSLGGFWFRPTIQHPMLGQAGHLATWLVLDAAQEGWLRVFAVSGHDV
jgi:hypothetical protein